MCGLWWWNLYLRGHNQFIQETCRRLSLSSDAGSGLLHILDCLVLCLLGFLVSGGGGLLGGSLLLLILGGSHRLLPLGLPDLGLLVPLGHDVLEGGTHNGSLELLGPLLPPVEHSPGHLTRVPLQDVSLVGSAR